MTMTAGWEAGADRRDHPRTGPVGKDDHCPNGCSIMHASQRASDSASDQRPGAVTQVVTYARSLPL